MKTWIVLACLCLVGCEDAQPLKPTPPPDPTPRPANCYVWHDPIYARGIWVCED